MADRFDKFTERARRVLTLAQLEADSAGTRVIDTGELLVGLVKEGDGVAARILNNLGVSLEKLRDLLKEVTLDQKPAEPSDGQGYGLTPAGKSAIAFAVDEAKLLGHHYIGTEHLLLGLMRLPESDVVHRVLKIAGLDIEAVRAETKRILSQSMPASAAADLGKFKQAREKAMEAFEKFGISEGSREVVQGLLAWRGLTRLADVRYLHTMGGRKQKVISIVAELLDLADSKTWFQGLEDEEKKKLESWFDHVMQEIWLPTLRDVLQIAPEEIDEAEEKFTEMANFLRAGKGES